MCANAACWVDSLYVVYATDKFIESSEKNECLSEPLPRGSDALQAGCFAKLERPGGLVTLAMLLRKAISSSNKVTIPDANGSSRGPVLA